MTYAVVSLEFEPARTMLSALKVMQIRNTKLDAKAFSRGAAVSVLRRPENKLPSLVSKVANIHRLTGLTASSQGD
jgi:hypothetical protein